jgi:hypothetical protein
MWRRPLLEVRKGGGGANILSGLAGLWLEVKTTDNAGQTSDKATILCVGPPSRVALPKRGDEYEILMGWEDEGLVLQGRFSFQKANASGTPGQGERVSLDFRAADYVDKLKGSGREHYDDKTFGDLMKSEAKKAGLEAVVDPELAKVKLGYRLRWDQSPIDFLTELGEEVGATVKPAGGKLVAMKRGGGKSGGGSELDPIIIKKRRGFGYDIEIEPRPEMGHIAAAWHDEKSGRRKLAKFETGRQGPYFVMPHPFRSEIEAREAAEALSYERGQNSGSGHFESPGLPHARAEAKVIASGYGTGIDGEWKAETVEKVVTSRGGFTTTVNVKAGKEKKGEKGK